VNGKPGGHKKGWAGKANRPALKKTPGLEPEPGGTRNKRGGRGVKGNGIPSPKRPNHTREKTAYPKKRRTGHRVKWGGRSGLKFRKEGESKRTGTEQVVIVRQKAAK